MSVVRIETELPFERLLQVVEQLSLPDLDRLLFQILRVQAKRKVPSLSTQETDLMLNVNQGLPPETQQRFDELVSKRQAETLTQDEQQEFVVLTDRIERQDAERMCSLAELARIRGTSLDVLMDALNIRPPAYA